MSMMQMNYASPCVRVRHACALTLSSAVVLSTAVWAAPAEPELNLESYAVYTNNFYYAAADARNGTGGVLQPSFSYSDKTTTSNWAFRTQAQAAFFSVGDDDNYVDTDTALEMGWRQNRVGLKGQVGFISGHDPFGIDRTAGLTYDNRELDRWIEPHTDLSITWGDQRQGLLSLQARGRYKLRDYVSNEATTGFLNRTEFRNDLVLGIKISPKTALLINPYQILVDFDQAPASGSVERSGETLGVLVGARWSATAKTSGDIRVGIASRSPDDGSASFDSSYWAAGINWAPNKLADLRLSTSRAYKPSYRADVRFIDEIRTRLQWEQRWNIRLDTLAALNVTSNDFIGSTDTDDYVSGNVRLNWRLEKAFALFAEGRFYERDSSRSAADTSQKEIRVGFKAKLN